MISSASFRCLLSRCEVVENSWSPIGDGNWRLLKSVQDIGKRLLRPEVERYSLNISRVS
jgi:hypothetical protein